MKSILFLILIWVMAACEAEDSSWSCSSSSFVAILSAPNDWAEQYVAISGVLAFEGDYVSSHLFMDQFSYDNHIIENAFFINLPPTEKKLQIANGKVAIICGKIALKSSENKHRKEPYIDLIKYVRVGGGTWENGKWDFENDEPQKIRKGDGERAEKK